MVFGVLFKYSFIVEQRGIEPRSSSVITRVDMVNLGGMVSPSTNRLRSYNVLCLYTLKTKGLAFCYQALMQRLKLCPYLRVNAS